MRSKQRKIEMGKGLSTVLGKVTNLTPRATSSEQPANCYVALSDIEPNPNQPRKVFDAADLQELADSIATLGLLTPLTLRKLPSGSYQIIAGERRFRAAKQAGLKQVPAFVLEVKEDLHSLELAIVENLQRVDLNPIELAHSFEHLLQEYNYTHEKLSERLSKSRASISNTLRLLKLPPEIQLALRDGKITEGHARAILSLDKQDMQIQVCQGIIAQNLSVRATEQWCSSLKQSASNIPKAKAGRGKSEFEGWNRQLSTHFSTKAYVKGRGDKGQIIIEYQSPTQLKQLLAQWGINDGT